MCLNRFRCQYQKGEKVYVSESIESKIPISSAQIILALATLAVKVEEKYGKKKGGKVALQILKIHEHVIRNIHDTKSVGTGVFSKSYYLDKRNKNKTNRSERGDLEFYGHFGFKDNTHILTEYINRFRKMKNWY